ncbi:SDR family NAD(P)-dependent oxidoreductase [Nonomuraea sp. NPDC000554]|uniref:SDR family NAD(P)-dependent oxidoreductase n=1 Tax=Nonomuraea sp. NPDC000554 TaxID=3154259 RepID=UPI00331742B8
MQVAMVTGAGKGIGREIVRRLATEGMIVYMGARDIARVREQARDLPGEVRPLRLDVTEQEQIEAAAARVTDECGRLDVLVNNAGVMLEWQHTATEVPMELVRRTYEVNVLGAVAVTQAFVPLLRRARPGRVVNVSSPLGSLSLLSDFGTLIAQRSHLAYGSSKAALNAVTLLYAKALVGDGILVNAANPGLVATDLNGGNGGLSVEQGAEVPVRLALLGEDGFTGRFVGDWRRGTPVEEPEASPDALVPW